MIQKTSQWFIEFFINLGLPFEGALLLTCMIFFLGFAAFVCVGTRVVKSRLCRPLRRYVDETYKEDYTYGPNTEG